MSCFANSKCSQKEHPLYTREGADLYLTLELSLVDSLCGFKRMVTMIDGETMIVEKPGPIEPESKETYPGLGMPYSKQPDQRGNLIVQFKIRYPQTLTQNQQTQIRHILSEVDGC